MIQHDCAVDDIILIFNQNILKAWKTKNALKHKRLHFVNKHVYLLRRRDESHL